MQSRDCVNSQIARNIYIWSHEVEISNESLEEGVGHALGLELGGEPGIDLHVILRHNAFVLTVK